MTHKEEGIGQPERHSIMIDMKDYSPPTREPRTDVPPAFPRDGATRKLDADRVIVWDVQLAEGQEAPLHVHNADTVAVFLEGGTIRSIDEDGVETDTTYAYKDVRYWPAGRAHREVVVDGAPRAFLFRAAGLAAISARNAKPPHDIPRTLFRACRARFHTDVSDRRSRLRRHRR